MVLLHGLLVRMSVVIVHPTGDERSLGLNRTQEVRRRGCLAAMMPGFQNRALHIGAIRCKDGLLLLLLRIAREHHGEIAKDQPPDYGLVVRIMLVALDISLLDQLRRRAKHLEHGSAAEIDTVARDESLALDLLFLELFHIAEVEL